MISEFEFLIWCKRYPIQSDEIYVICKLLPFIFNLQFNEMYLMELDILQIQNRFWASYFENFNKKY